MQEDKEGLFDTVQTVQMSLSIFISMMSSLKVKTDQMRQAASEDLSNATVLANYLVNKGLPFRQAHTVVGQCVKYCVENKLILSEMPLPKFQQYCPLFAKDLYPHLQLENVVESCLAQGGTNKSSVLQQLQQARALLAAKQDWLQSKNNTLNKNEMEIPAQLRGDR